MDSSLYLFPLPVLGEPPAVPLIASLLQDCGFMGGRLDGQHYLTGPDFFRYITFAGCSPRLQLETPAGGGWDFCHISLHEDHCPPSLQVAALRGRPRCPACRSNVFGWKEQLTGWREDASRPWRCENCQTLLPAAELDWRQYGFAARCSVEIHQVYPGEAVPTDGLMSLLKEGTGRDWRHAWVDKPAV
ncbi:hypothetical protein [Thiolapillus sp.]